MYYNKSYWTAGILYLVMFLVGSGSSVHAQYGGTAGAFARIGFGARGVAMGNAMTAVVSGELSPYYNPALTAFQSDHVITAAYTVMSLDRSLNFLQYSQHLKKSAGVAIGFIQSGVSKIDGRDSDGIPTGDLSTSEYLFFASFANSFTDKLTFGVTFKYYYYKLYENITAYSAAVDLGCIYAINKNMSVGIAVNDLGAKYRWDTSKIYGDQGTTTIDAFPTIIKIGIAETLFDSTVTAAIDYVTSPQDTHHLHVGVEWNPLESFSLRAGCDRIDLQDRWSGAMPTFGFAVSCPLPGWRPTIHYAYGIEPFAPSGIHIISVTVGF